MLEDHLNGQYYKCYYCKKKKLYDKFWLLPDDSSLRIGNRPVYIFCITCDYERKRKVKYKVPCKICNKYYKLQENGNCKKCIKKAGLKKCYCCKQLMLSLFDFYCINSRYCKKCDNKKRAESYRKTKKLKKHA